MNENRMFCYQCEQTARGSGCTMGGVCGKSAETAGAQDDLTAALVRLAGACAAHGGVPSAGAVTLWVEVLFMCVTKWNFDLETVRFCCAAGDAAAQRLASGSPFAAFTLPSVWSEPAPLRSLKSLLLFGLRGMAAYAHHAAVLGRHDPVVDAFFVKGLAALAENREAGALTDLVLELGRANGACMALLDAVHRETYGEPTPTQVPLAVEPGPFVVVTGHDLHDLKQLLEQTEGTGVAVYTHGEMLPAHGYPELRRYRHLKGHFGTAWQNQQKEFDGLPAPILWTTNCLMPPRSSYADRVWTTGLVRYPGVHVVAEADGAKDFSALIAQARALGGWPERKTFTGINGGTSVWTGFGHHAILAQADKLADAVRRGVVTRILLVGGCDGARPGRNYYTELVRRAPKDWIVLTLACGKFRFNDLDLGEIGGIPRLMDLGQCNDAHGAIQVALAFAKLFNCGVNDLPLSLVLSWYEQKAVAVLLTLLALGVRNIRLGPTPPAFVSPEILDVLVTQFGLHLTGDVDADLAALAAGNR